MNYPDSVIPIISILKQLALFESSVRYELSIQIDILFNIIRSTYISPHFFFLSLITLILIFMSTYRISGLFLFPNNEWVKSDGAQLLCLLLYSEYVIKVTEKDVENSGTSHISLPYIVQTSMKLPFACRYHWKTSLHRRSNISCKYLFSYISQGVFKPTKAALSIFCKAI